VSRADALRNATIDGAYLSMSENDKGSIEIGKLGDFAVLSTDPLTCPEDALKDVSADMTVVGGRVVYEKSS
jgi:predicted amidohydrolase YtcJ